MGVDEKRAVLLRFLTERRQMLPRKGAVFLERILRSGPLETMQFCRAGERARLRDSVLIITTGVSVWGVLLGNEGAGGPERRVRLCLELLDLTPEQVIERLEPLPIWFLCIDEAYSPPVGGNAAELEAAARTFPCAGLRRLALLDQIDAALDDRDFDRLARLRQLLLA